MSQFLKGRVALNIGINDPMNIRLVVHDPFQVTVRMIASKTDGNDKRSMAEQIIIHVRLIYKTNFCAAEDLFNQQSIFIALRQAADCHLMQIERIDPFSVTVSTHLCEAEQYTLVWKHSGELGCGRVIAIENDGIAQIVSKKLHHRFQLCIP